MKNCVISVGINEWYPKGIDRLQNSLIHVKYSGYTILSKELPEGADDHQTTPYHFKVMAFIEAFNQGFDNVLWLDASIWCNKDPQSIFDIIQEQGYFLVHNPGHTTGQWCNDEALPLLNTTREEVDLMAHLSSGFIGLNSQSKEAAELFQLWLKTDKQAYRGNWANHRHDQTILSVHSQHLGMVWNEPKGILDYDCKDDSIFYLKGM